MRCLSDETIIKYLNNLLGNSEYIKAKNHLESCKSCNVAIKAELDFDDILRSTLKQDHKIAGFAQSVLEKARLKECKKPAFIRRIAIAGGILWSIAVFNSLALFFLILHLNNYSFTKIIVSLKDFLLTLSRFQFIYSIWIQTISTTLILTVAFSFLILFSLKQLVLKTTKN